MIHQKILNIMRKVEYLAKDDKVEFGNTKYKALSEEKVTTIMRKALVDEGIVVYPVDMIETRDGNITHVHVKYALVDTEDNSAIEVVSCGDGYDTQDKGSGKAMTYAYKYMYLRTFAIPTGEDPDKISSAEIDDKVAKAKENKNRAKSAEDIASSKISETKVRTLIKKCADNEVDTDKVCALYGVQDPSELTESQFSDIANNWSKKVVPQCKVG